MTIYLTLLNKKYKTVSWLSFREVLA